MSTKPVELLHNTAIGPLYGKSDRIPEETPAVFCASVQCYECSSPQQHIQIEMLIFKYLSHENRLRDMCVVMLSRLHARRSLILPSSTNTSLNHLLSSICTYVNHFIKTQCKFFHGTFYYFVGELFSSCVIVDGSRSRQVFGNLKVVMNA